MDLKSSFNKICRICMKEERQMLRIFNNNSISICDKVWFCTSVKIVDNDGLPALICKTCSHNLNIAYEFTELCKQTDMTLRKCLNTEEIDMDNASFDDIVSYGDLDSDDSNSSFEERPQKKKVPSKPKIVTSLCTTQYIEVKDISKNKEPILITITSEPQLVELKEEAVKIDIVSKSSDQQEIDDFTSILESDFKCYICEICAKGFDTRANLKAHVKRHEDVRPFQCEQCDKAFRERSTLKVHMRCHTGEKPFQCAICSKTFTQNSSLKSHMRSHTRETPYKCDLCGRTFTALSNYSKHCRAHRNERKYACNICGAAFNFNHGLKKHTMIHTGERPFSCEICEKSFMRRTNLTTHMRIHNGEMPYSCDICTKSFRYNSVLKSHLKSKHDILIPPSIPLAEFHP